MCSGGRRAVRARRLAAPWWPRRSGSTHQCSTRLPRPCVATHAPGPRCDAIDAARLPAGCCTHACTTSVRYPPRVSGGGPEPGSRATTLAVVTGAARRRASLVAFGLAEIVAFVFWLGVGRADWFYIDE